jgi:hypothetical protein
MIYKLPEDILRKIYEYDDTYKHIFDTVIEQMMLTFEKYNRYVHYELFHNDLFYNLHFCVYDIFHFVRNSNKLLP